MIKKIEGLTTIRDYIRYAVSKFNKAKLSYSNFGYNAMNEASYLITEMLDLPADKLELFLDAKLTEEEIEKVVDIIDKRIKTRKPAAYLTNKANVQGYSIYVDERVNLPRPFLAELMLSDIIGGSEFNLIDEPKAVKSVLDLCCGSAFLSIIAADVFPNAEIHAVDVSKDALEVAKMNIKDFGLENRITLHEGDLFDSVEDEKFDLILSNPPYLSEDTIKAMPLEYAHEPKRALESGQDGIKIIRRIISTAGKHLNRNGMLLCEVGDSRESLIKAFPQLNFMWFDIENSPNNAFWLTQDELVI